ncbi:glycosyltransferase [Bradyrhizobium jicamae]|uniref:Glycosyltransferase n=1 Tax=Bradyrhizobium jicamae TaxID=280332 RepID=A0ABS5FUQ1_9BRAD|nr:glycosyltransferase [Bradyrhizobium jicamae]MBR0800503.1 glycosyltransferase [Bradyrhizobium jicamae]
MRVLFVHQNFPAQFRHVAQFLEQAGDQVIAVTDAKNTQARLVKTLEYHVEPALVGTPPPPLAPFAGQVVRARAVAEVMLNLRNKGFIPDLVIGHVGWGECLAVRDIWPATKFGIHAEFYYASEGANIGFDPEFQSLLSFDERFAVRLRNAPLLLSMTDADFGIAPTIWQKERYPASLKSKIHVFHEGVDTDLVAPSQSSNFVLPSGRALTAHDEVITFVNRNLEPYRGYHIFMRALPRVLAERQNAHVVIVGGNGASYGPAPQDGRSWKDIFFNEVKDSLPADRVHFVGKIPYASFIALMQLSSAHVYLTYPFVLSWSMLEAMSASALVIASKTAPVEEVITDNDNGLLFNFFDIETLADIVIEALAEPSRFSEIRENARRHIVEQYDLKRRCLPQWTNFVRQFDPVRRGSA